MGGNLSSLETSKNSFIFGDGPSTPSLGIANITVAGYSFWIDVVPHNVPGLLGLDILTSRCKDRSVFDLRLGDRKIMIDGKGIDLLGDYDNHLHLPDDLVKICKQFRLPDMCYFQVRPADLPHDHARGPDLPGVGERQLGEASPPPSHKKPQKGKSKTILDDIKTEQTASVRLRKQDYDRPDVILAKNEELEKFFKFNVIKTVPQAPRNANIMRTTWVITEKTDNMTKTGKKVKARLCTMGNSAKEFSKNSIQFESPTCGRDTVKAILSLVPDNQWKIATFDVSSAFFQGDSLQREVYVKNPDGPGFWELNAALYGLREGARNWYNRFHRHVVSLGFVPAPGDPASYSYDRDGIQGALAIHVDDALSCGTDEFFEKILVPLLCQFSISKLEQGSFKFLGMHLEQADDFSVRISQDSKTVKSLPPGVDSLPEEEKQVLLKSLVGQLLYLDLTRPDLAYLISDLARSSSKTTDERLRIARILLRKISEPAKSILYRPTRTSCINIQCYVDASYNQATDSGVKFNVRGSISGLMGRNDTFSPVIWKTSEIKRKISSVKSAELFALDYGAGQLVYMKDLYGHFSSKPITLTLLTDSQTTIDSLRSVRPIVDRMNQHLLDNVKKCVDQVGITVRFVETGRNLADPLTKKIKDHAVMTNVMAAKSMYS